MSVWQIDVTEAEADAVEQLIMWAISRGEYTFGKSRGEALSLAGKLREALATAAETCLIHNRRMLYDGCAVLGCPNG